MDTKAEMIMDWIVFALALPMLVVEIFIINRRIK